MKHIRSLILSAQILLVALLCVQSINSYAIPASPKAATITQPNGAKITIQTHGDEFFNYTTTSDGYTIAMSTDRYYYYADYNTGSLRMSSTRVGENTSKTNLAKGVMPSIITMNRTRAIASYVGQMNQAVTRASTKAGFFPPAVPVVLAQYADVQFITPNPKAAFTAMMNERGYSANGGTGSIADYYFDNSNGVFTPAFVVSDIVTLSKNRQYYGNTSGGGTARDQLHAEDICRLASTQNGGSIDFGQYDANNDQIVDIVLIYYAGGNAAEGIAEAVWPHKHLIPSLNLNGKRVSEYACSSELRGTGNDMCGIGTMTHEYGHTLGLADVYDTSSGKTGLNAPRTWNDIGLMNGGGYNNSGRTPPHLMAYERAHLGWLTFTDITTTADIVLEPIQNNKAYRLETGNVGEYFTFENRQGTLWDKYVTATPLQGMVVIHIDRSGNDVGGATAGTRWTYNSVNEVLDHQCADYIESTGIQMINQPLKDTYYPGTKGNTSLSHSTIPNIAPWSGKDLGVSLTNIALAGSNVTFRATVTTIDATKVQLSGQVKDIKAKPIANARIDIYESITPSGTGVGPLYMSPSAIKTRATPAYTTVSDANGGYTINNVLPRAYIVEVKQTGYVDFSETKTWTVPTSVKYDLTLTPESTEGLNELRWHDNSTTGITYVQHKVNGVARQYWSAVEFGPTDLIYYQANRIEAVTVQTNIPTDVFEVTIKSGSIVLGTKTEYTASGNTLWFDFSDLKISKKNSRSLRVEVKSKAVALDPATKIVPNKGNLYSTDGANWSPLPETTYNGNWMISVILNNTTSTEPVVENLQATSNQLEALVTWSTTPAGSATKWQVRWRKPTDSNYSIFNSDKESFLIKNLAANTTYDVEVAPMDTFNEPLEFKTTTVSTTDVSAPYPALFLTQLQYKVGDDVMLMIQNKPAGVAWVKYTVNDTEVTTDSYKINAKGVYTFVAEITYSAGSVEKITRKIKVN